MTGKPLGRHAADWILMLVLVVGFSCQVVVFHRVIQLLPDTGFSIGGAFARLAANLGQHGTIGEMSEAAGVVLPDTRHAPLFPAVMALVYRAFGMEARWALVVNNFCYALTLVLTFLLGRRLHPWGGVFVVLFVVLDPLFLYASNAVTPDALFLLLTVWLMWHVLWVLREGVTARRVAGVAVLLSLLELAQPIGLYAWLAVGGAIAFHQWRRIPWRYLLMLLGVIVFVQAGTVGLWSLRQVMAGGTFSFAATNGAGLGEMIGAFPALYLSLPVDLFALFLDPEGQEHLGAYLGHHAILARSWSEWLTAVRQLVASGYGSLVAVDLFSKVASLSLLILAVAGAWRSRRDTDRAAAATGLFLALLFVCFVAGSAVYATGNYRLPMVPVVNLLAFYAVWGIVRPGSAAVAATPAREFLPVEGGDATAAVAASSTIATGPELVTPPAEGGEVTSGVMLAGNASPSDTGDKTETNKRG
ncbi:MAG: glycosyltransferase family 39 protein [Magnetococcales bacterium]|nr:glycosyltransferase family 39 protein [Magnetococcales bacterium]